MLIGITNPLLLTFGLAGTQVLCLNPKERHGVRRLLRISRHTSPSLKSEKAQRLYGNAASDLRVGYFVRWIIRSGII